MLAQYIATRLKEAIAMERSSERAFARDMAERLGKGKGASRAMIQKYLGGTTVPPVEFLLEAAALLRVELEWLLTGVGPPTRRIHPHTQPVDMQQIGRSLIVDKMAARYNLPRGASYMDATAQTEMLSAALRIVQARDKGEGPDPYYSEEAWDVAVEELVDALASVHGAFARRIPVVSAWPNWEYVSRFMEVGARAIGFLHENASAAAMNRRHFPDQGLPEHSGPVLEPGEWDVPTGSWPITDKTLTPKPAPEHADQASA